MKAFNFSTPNKLLFIVFLVSLWVVVVSLGCKTKTAQCDAYTYDDSWQDEDWFDDDKLVQINDTTFYIRINDTLINVDSLCTYK
mgnify:CR=1 FL=1